MKTFVDAYLRKEENPVVCYRSALTLYEEKLIESSLYPCGWNTAGFTLNVLENYPSHIKHDSNYNFNAEAFRFDVDGETIRDGWIFDGFENEKTDKDTRTTLSLLHDSKRFKAKVVTELDGTAILSRYIKIENLTNTKLKISNVYIMSGPLFEITDWKDYGTDMGNKLFSIGYFDHSDHMKEGGWAWHDTMQAKLTVSSKYDYDRFRHPAFMVKNNVSGAICFAQLAYSSAYAFDFWYNNTKNNALLSFCARIDGDNPTYILDGKQTFTSPALHIGCMQGDMDDIINEMHAHTRKSVFTMPMPDCAKGGIIEGGMGPERLMDERAVKHFCNTLQKVGAETLIIDAGWYCPPNFENEWSPRTGDWVADKDLYPEGMEKMREIAKSKGLLFGVWVEPERAGWKSEFAKNHPEFFIKYKGRITDVLDLSKDEVALHVKNELERIICEYKLDILRIDYNINAHFINYKNERGENGTFRYYENLYGIFEYLHNKYPNVIFENCASGGGRTDLGLVKYFTHTWVTDNQRAPRSVAITNDYTIVLPPEYVDRLSSGMDSHRIGDIDLLARNTLFGRPTSNTYNSMESSFNEVQLERVKHAFDIYKNVIRPFAPTGKIYHHTPCVEGYMPKGYIVMERSSENKDTSVVGIFRLTDDNNNVISVYPKGIDKSKDYYVTFDNDNATIKLSGYEISKGLRVSLNTNLTSELIIIKQA